MVLMVVNAFLLYGRSLSYPFVYDDLWRIVNNESINRIGNPARFFTDINTQSSIPGLNRDNYRPLVPLSFALDHALFGNNPAGYRAENILLHGVNGALVSYLGMEILSLSPPAALLAGLIFINHPVQIESVAWVAERTNVLGILFLLLTLLFWVNFQKGGGRKSALGAHLFLCASLLTREIAVVVPLYILFIDFLKKFQKRWPHYCLAAGEVTAFLAVRYFVLGQVKISPFKGGTIFSNLANVVQMWPGYWRVVLFPSRLRITYSDIEPATHLLTGKAVVGAFCLLIFFVFLFYGIKRARNWGLALGTIFFFWLPGSNLIPLTTMFGERLLYPMMAGFGWMGGLLYERLGWSRSKDVWLRRAFSILLITLLAGLSWVQLPVWRSELSLWENAVQQAPRAWFAWACYGQMLQAEAKKRVGRNPSEEMIWWKGSALALEEAFKNGPPRESAGQLLVMLAKSKYQLGEKAEASKLLQKASRLNPAPVQKK